MIQDPRQFLHRTEQEQRLHAVLQRPRGQDDSPSPAGGTGSSEALSPVPQPSPTAKHLYLNLRPAAPVRGAPAPRIAGAALR